jgi:hypothetical protein
VQRDVDASAAFWAAYEGPARDAQEGFNDRYLKLNGIPEGVQAYAESAKLLVLFARYNGGRVVPASGVHDDHGPESAIRPAPGNPVVPLQGSDPRHLKMT